MSFGATGSARDGSTMAVLQSHYLSPSLRTLRSWFVPHTSYLIAKRHSS